MTPPCPDAGGDVGVAGESPDVTVVLPVFRNLGQLPELVRRLIAALEPTGDRFTLLFVEDAGGDGSLEWLQAVHDPRVRVIAMPVNTGQHRAVLEGLRASRAEVTVVMDADLQDPPEQVPRLVDELRRRGGVVAARRREAYQSSGRHVTGRLFKATLRWIAGGIPPGISMFLAIPAGAREQVLALAEERPYIPLLLVRTGAHFHMVDIPKARREEGGSSYTAWRRFLMGVRAVRQAVRWRMTSRATGVGSHVRPKR